MRTITVDQYREFGERVFLNTGISEYDAKLVTDTLLYASLRGHDSHGLGHIGMYVRGLMGLPGSATFSGVNKSPNMKKVKESPAVVAIDADWAMGHKATQYATELVIKKAKTLGIGAATIYNTTHNGALGYFTLQMVEQGMIGMAFTNAGACTPPWGGTQRMLGTNPMSMAFPAGEEYPIVFDMATSSTVWLTIIPIVMSGAPLPESTLLNDDGEFTTSLDEFTTVGVQGKPKGSMANMANNHKGYNIQLSVEMLAGILPALISGQQVTTEGHFHNPTLLMALDISFFQDLAAFKKRTDERIRELKASKKKPGVSEILLPGENGFRKRDKYLKEGIPVSDYVWNDLQKLSAECNVPLPEPAGAPA